VAVDADGGVEPGDVKNQFVRMRGGVLEEIGRGDSADLKNHIAKAGDLAAFRAEAQDVLSGRVDAAGEIEREAAAGPLPNEVGGPEMRDGIPVSGRSDAGIVDGEGANHRIALRFGDAQPHGIDDVRRYRLNALVADGGALAERNPCAVGAALQLIGAHALAAGDLLLQDDGIDASTRRAARRPACVRRDG